MDILSIFIIVVLGIWFVLGIVCIYKKRGNGCMSCGRSCGMNGTSCMGCSRRKEDEKAYRKKNKE